jgi:hypothetical protein
MAVLQDMWRCLPSASVSHDPPPWRLCSQAPRRGKAPARAASTSAEPVLSAAEKLAPAARGPEAD